MAKPMRLEQAIRAVGKSATMKEAKLCPCTNCRNRVRHLVWGLLGYKTSDEINSVPNLEGIDEAVVAAVELGIEDLMTQLTAEPARRPLILMGTPTGRMSSGYPKGGRSK